MRPLKLTMSAFGTFADKTQIDFRKFGESGVYLITGDTGAGKTTIFDAICFALYGSPSGQNRTEKMLRSDYADDSVRTFVELEFEFDGKTYKVERNPEYTRKKTRGEGTTKENKQATLFLPDGKIISGYSEVKNEIINIMGLDKERFSRVAMIAQGDFQKLLFSDTKDRVALFRKIFGTNNYERLQEELKELSTSAQNEYKAEISALKQYFSGLICDEYDEKYSEFSTINGQDFIEPETAYTFAEALIKRDSASLSLVDEKLKAEKSKLLKLNAEMGVLQEQLKKVKRAEVLKQLIIENDIKIKSALKEKENAENMAKQIPELTKLSAKIRAQIPEYDELTRLETEIKAIDNEINSLTEQITNNTTKLKDYDKTLKETQNEINTEVEIISRLSDEKAEILKLTDKSEKLGQLNDLYEKYEKAKRQSLKAKSEYEILKSQLETLQNEYNAANNSFLDAQAGLLAQELKENEPCPVCGSTKHPSPAQVCNTIPDKQELGTMRETLNTHNQKTHNASVLTGEKRTEAKQLSESIINLAKEVFECFENCELPVMIKSASTEIENLLTEHNQTKIDLENKLDSIKTAKGKLPEINVKITEVEKSLKSDNEKLAYFTAQKTEKSEQITQIKGKLDYNLKQEAEEKAAAYDLKVTELNSELNSAREKVNKLAEKGGELKGEFDSIKNIKTADNSIELQSLIDQTNKNDIDLTSKHDKLFSRLETNKSACENIKKCGEKLKTAEEKTKTLDLLSRVASGNVSQKQKLSLEAYIQTVYFDNILYKANTRLFRMSNGRYELIRSVSADTLNSQTGLEIDVIDHHTGCTRKVKSLSGGESFLASLSLALGLSDEIQSHGKIPLECMFIDEGFGTLDDSTLSLAINAFNNLSSGRLVGIISHVTELKLKIDRQLLVKKGEKGSSVTISDF